VKQASEKLAQAAALQHYLDAEAWSKEITSRRARAEVLAPDGAAKKGVGGRESGRERVRALARER
jgi:hypothetical protein